MISPISIRKELLRLASKRILILDGSMGTLIQACGSPAGEETPPAGVRPEEAPGRPLDENDFRGLTGSGVWGERFKTHPVSLKGCNDVLCLTMPEFISGIHEDYLKAGADIIETNSFNASAVSLAGFGLEDLAYEISAAAARLARKAADTYSTRDKPRFVAGSMGPTAKSAGLSHDMNNPEKRAVTWDELEAAYYDNARGLLDGGADMLIIETVFDTLNAKAAIFAARRLAEERGVDVPLIVSATVNNGGRLLSGQSVEAFCVSVLHANPLALGLNCSFGAEKLKPHIAAVSSAVPCMVSAYPNAGLPNHLGAYDENPESMADHVEGYLRDGIVNIIGGCCGSTPAHIAAIAKRAKNYAPRPLPVLPKRTLLAGMEVLEVSRASGLAKIGGQTNAAESRDFLKFIKEKNYDEAVDLARDMAEAGAPLIHVRVDDTLPGAKAAMADFLNLALVFPDIARLPVAIDSSCWEVIEAGLKCLPGKGLINSVSLKEGEAEFLRRARLARNYGAAIVVTLFDDEGQALSCERGIAAAARCWNLLKNVGFPPEDIVFDPAVPAAADISRDSPYAPDFIRTCAWIRDNCPGAQILGEVSNLSSALPNREGKDAARRDLVPLEDARKNRVNLSWPIFSAEPGIRGGNGFPNLPEIIGFPPGSESTGHSLVLNNYPLGRVIPHIDWTSFAQTWDLAVNTYPSAYDAKKLAAAKKNLEKLLEDAKILLEKIASSGVIRLRGVVGFFPAYSEGDDIVIPQPFARFSFPRNQEQKLNGEPNPCLSDFIVSRELFEKEQFSAAPNPMGQIGLFALGAGFGFREAEEKYRRRKDNYGAILLTGLVNSLAEAFSEEIHRHLRCSWGGGIRPSFGYPACPDHRDKETAFRLLDAQKRCGFELTETAMIIPAATVCGMYMAHPDSFYFSVGMIGDDQVHDWAGRKGISPEEAGKRLGGF